MHIDATTYDQKVAQAASGVEQAKNTLANQTQSIAQKQADIVAAQAKVEQVRAQYELSLAQLRRYQQLGIVEQLLNLSKIKPLLMPKIILQPLNRQRPMF